MVRISQSASFLEYFVPYWELRQASPLVLYCIGAILSHLRVKDFKGVGPAFFMFVAVTVALIMRLHLGPHPHWYRF